MSRDPRQDYPGAWHHVMSRGADKQDIFSSEIDYTRFENLLAEAVDRFNIEIHAYALMSNHYHLLLHCPDGGVSAAMQFVLSSYAEGYNYFYERDGSLFSGRFVSVLIEDDDHLHVEGRYVHRNPLAFIPVSLLAAYRWSSYGVYLGGRSQPDWLETGALIGRFDDDCGRYRSFVETWQPRDKSHPLGRCGERKLSLVDVDHSVEAETGVEGARLSTSRRRATNDPRMIAISVAVDLRVASTSEIADHYNLAGQSSVRSVARRSRVRAVGDVDFSALRDRVLSAVLRAAS